MGTWAFITLVCQFFIDSKFFVIKSEKEKRQRCKVRAERNQRPSSSSPSSVSRDRNLDP